MSGIAGQVHFNGELVKPESMLCMLATLRRRGPDRQTVHCDGNVGASGQRLRGGFRQPPG